MKFSGSTSLRRLRTGQIEGKGWLTALPASIGELSQLRRLNLRNNAITELPESVGALDRLTHLDLRANPLRALPEAIGHILTLEKLDLRWCRLERLPAWVEALRTRGVVVFT